MARLMRSKGEFAITTTSEAAAAQIAVGDVVDLDADVSPHKLGYTFAEALAGRLDAFEPSESTADRPHGRGRRPLPDETVITP